MVKTKRQLLKSKKQHQHQHPNKGKKQGKAGDLEQFRVQLDGLGLKIVQVTADGNCFFRSLADQLEGNEDEHMKYRLMVVKYIRKHREEFEPFIEDDVLFDDYCKSMEEDGTWAGHMELQAASLVTQCNICIHRMMSPRWYIQNFNSERARMVHLSYHDGEHYNSVRLKYDDGVGPAKVIIIKADANLSSASSQQISSKSSATLHDKSVDAVAVNKVMSEAGCHDVKKVEEVLQEFNGDIDVAIQFLIAEGAADECSTNDDNCHKIDINSACAQDKHGDHDAEKQEETFQNDCLLGQTVDDCEDLLTKNDHREPSEKKIARNKVCPCGSRKKYKACCGSGPQKKPANVVIPQEIHYGKGRKAKKHVRRKMEPVNTSPHEACKGQIDMGALCI